MFHGTEFLAINTVVVFFGALKALLGLEAPKECFFFNTRK
jgi:hypothetical protein